MHCGRTRGRAACGWFMENGMKTQFESDASFHILHDKKPNIGHNCLPNKTPIPNGTRLGWQITAVRRYWSNGSRERGAKEVDVVRLDGTVWVTTDSRRGYLVLGAARCLLRGVRKNRSNFVDGIRYRCEFAPNWGRIQWNEPHEVLYVSKQRDYEEFWSKREGKKRW